MKDRGAIHWWTHLYCDHQDAVAGFYGRAVTLGCIDCNRMIRLRYNHDAHNFYCEYGSDMYNQRTETISVQDGIEQINRYAKEIRIPEGYADPTDEENYEEDAKRLKRTLRILRKNGLYA